MTTAVVLGWNAHYNASRDQVHVMPESDLDPHTYATCACDPTFEEVPREEGAPGTLVIHNAFDRRELNE